MPEREYSALDRLVQKMVDAGKLPRASPHTCSYFNDREAIEEGFLVERLHPEIYHDLMDKHFRRSGNILYRPRCEGCQACVPIRIPTALFRPSRSQRRVWRRNQDIIATVETPTIDDERVDLYRRYLEYQHPDSSQTENAEGLKSFLYTSCVETLEVAYRLPDGKLIGISILDISQQSLSSVYHFFDPEERRRSIGVFSILYELEFCKSKGIPYFYLGYWIKGAPTMDYKADYFPHELLREWGWEQIIKAKTSPQNEKISPKTTT